MYCANCGVPNDAMASACGSCGATMSSGLEVDRSSQDGRAQKAQTFDPSSLYGEQRTYVAGQPQYGSFAESQGANLVHTPSSATVNYSTSSKSRVVYGLLAFLFGFWGVHNFYAGHTSKGLTQLLVTSLSCGLLAMPMYLWSLAEILVCPEDGDGRTMFW